MTFEGGSTATGTFQIDDTTGQLLDWNIFATSNGTLQNIHFTPAFTAGSAQTTSEFSVLAVPISTGVKFHFLNPLTVPGENPLVLTGFDSGSYFYGAPGGFFESYAAIAGSAVGVAAVPEPESYAMLVAGLLLIGALKARRKG